MDSEYINLGGTEVHKASVLAMSEQEFKSTFKGVLLTDINDAWKQVKKLQPKTSKPKRQSKKKD